MHVPVGSGVVPPQAVLSSVRIRFSFGIQFKLFGKKKKKKTYLSLFFRHDFFPKWINFEKIDQK